MINDKVIIRYIGPDNPLSLRTGKSYEARRLMLGWYGVVDETGEEYAYPPEVFERMYKGNTCVKAGKNGEIKILDVMV